MKHSYTAYGLSLRSDVELPGLTETASQVRSNPVDFISQHKPQWVVDAAQLPGQVIHSLPAEPECADPTFVVTETADGRHFELAYGDGTEFWVDAAGERVWGSFLPPMTPEDLATYFLGPVLGFVLRRRGVTPLHASGVLIGDVAVAICGVAGAGKSTTAAALGLRGAGVICEDIAALVEERGQFSLQPGYPRVCLWPDAVEKLLGDRSALPDLTPTWNKKYLALDGKRARFAERSMRLGRIYLLGERIADNRAPRIEQMSGREALMELVTNTYMNALLAKEQRASEFELLSRLVNRVSCRRVTPSSDAKRIEELCELIEKDAVKNGAERQTALTGRGE